MYTPDLFSHENPKPVKIDPVDTLTIFMYKREGQFVEATIPRSVKKQGGRVARQYITDHNIFLRSAGSTPFGIGP